MSFLEPTHLIQAFGLIGVSFIVFAETGLFFGIIFPGDSLLFAVGILGAEGHLNIWVYVVALIISAILGDNFGYMTGKKLGPKIFKKENSFFFDKEYIEKSEKFYKKYGVFTIIIARYTPVVRTFAPILAGVGNMEYKKFLKWNIIGGIFWVSSIVLPSYFLARQIDGLDKYIVPVFILAAIGTAVPVIFQAIKRKRAIIKKGKENS